MALRVLTAASTSALITLAAVKDRLGITDSSQDAALTQLIAEASSAIVAFLGYDLARQRYEERRPGNGSALLQLARFPIDRASVSLEIDDVAQTDFSVDDEMLGHLFRPCGWTGPCSAEDRNNVVIAYKAGYVLPGQITTWTAGATVALGSWLRPTSPALSPLLFEVTTAGILHSAEPTWPTTVDATVVNGTATLTARDAIELPAVIQQCAWLTVYDFQQRVSRAPGLSSLSADGFEQSFFATQTETKLPPNVERSLQIWRVPRV